MDRDSDHPEAGPSRGPSDSGRKRKVSPQESPEQRDVRLAARRARRQQESPEQREARLAKNREAYHARRRRSATPPSAQQERKRELERERRRAKSLCEEQQEEKRLRDRERQRAKSLSEEQREQKRLRDKERQRAKSLSEEQREQKRLRDKERQRAKSLSEEQREQKRLRDRERQSAKSLSEEQREEKRLRDRERQKSLSEEQREQKRLRERERRRAKRKEAGESSTGQQHTGAGENDGVCDIPAPVYPQADDALVVDSDADSDCESLGGDFDTDSEAGEEDSPLVFKKPNDPAVLADVCKKVQHALAGVCASRCYVCDRLLNERARRRVDLQRVREADRGAVQQLLDDIVTVPGQYDVCATCRSYVVKKEVPPSAAVNGFHYPAMPPGLRPLTEVEEAILALRLPFQQIVHLGTMGRRGQYGVRGSVINVPTDAPETVRTVIPLLPEEDEMCVVNVKRKLVHKRAYARSFADKDKLVEWGRFLQNSTLYREHGAVFDETRLDALPTDQDNEPRTNEDGEVFFGIPDEPEDAHDMHERLGTIQHTLLMEDRAEPATSRANPETDEVDVAPGEHKIPVSVAWDHKAEELAFPGVYLGEPRTFKRHVTRYQAMRSELRRMDRRGARPQSILYKYNMHVRKQASGCLRHKVKCGVKHVLGKDITREQLLDKNFVSSLQKEGFAMSSLLPNSTEYWRRRSHDLFAMVRQLGRPHLWLTLSSPAYHSPTLMKVLKELHRQHGEMDRFAAAHMEADTALPQTEAADAMDAVNDVLQEEELNDARLPSEEKLRLIREDPVVCASYFREIVLQLRKYLRLKKNGPMGKYYVKDWFIRTEFQQCGSPRAHCLLWLNDGPDQPLDDLDKTTAFIDDMITCDSSHSLAGRNKHHHTSNCFKNSHEAHNRCGVPFWPTPTTRVVMPLHAEKDERAEEAREGMDWASYIDYLRDLRLKLKDVLAASDCPETLEEVWDAAGCPDDATYELAIRTGVHRPQVLYKRAVADRWTNSYLKWILDAFGANTEAQVVLDIDSLARYCVSYAIKAEKSHSQLHNEITRMRREQGFDDSTLMKMLRSRTLRAKETSAEEAAWVLLEFPLSETSRKCTYIDTSPKQQRVFCPKPTKVILAQPEGSTDLWYPDVFDTYSRRREDLEDITLAQYSAYHHQSKEEKARRLPRIIRYRRFAENSDDLKERENFYRSMCILHLPWRDEDQILNAGRNASFKRLYATNEDAILTRRKAFEALLGLEACLEEGIEACIAEDEAAVLEADSSARNMLGGSKKLTFLKDDEVAEFMDCDAQDIAIDLPQPAQSQAATPAQVRRRVVWDDQTFLDNIRRLNRQQREVVLAIIHDVRTQATPRLIYIDGAAGTGKTVVARNLANAFEKFSPGNCAEDSSRVVVSAPTGKAAYNVDGGTMHSVYSLPYNLRASNVMLPLQGQQLAKMQKKFSNVHAQIIDEVSMVSNRNLLDVDQRCKEAKSSNADFGGLWTITFGDFRQLAPVGGSPVYVSPTESLEGSSLLWQKFEYVELTQNMRQGEDKLFAELLTRIGDAEKPLSDQDRAKIESRFVSENNLTIPSDCFRIYHQNKVKDGYNLAELLKAPSRQIVTLPARDRVQENRRYQSLAAGCRRRKNHERSDDILERAEALPTAKAQGLPALLRAVVGRPYKITTNIRVSDGLVNGAVGILKWVQVGVLWPSSRTPGQTTPELAVQRLWLRFPGDVGATTSRAARELLRTTIARQKSLPQDLVDALPFDLPPCPEDAEMEGLVPVERLDKLLVKLRTEKWRYVVRQQFPLVPSLADTIHSSQGSSYDKVCVEYYDGMDNTMVYVALSRVRTLDGLYITTSIKDGQGRKAAGRGLRSAAGASKLFKHPRLDRKNERMAQEKERLRSKPFTRTWAPLAQRPPTGLRVVHHNVRSLNDHHPDVTLDDVFMEADILLLAETCLRADQDIVLTNGMLQVARCDAPTQHHSTQHPAPAGGVAVFSKLPLCQAQAFNTLPLIEAASARQGDELLVAVLYCHVGAKLDHILEAVQAVLPANAAHTTVLSADFNVDMQSTAGRRISSALEARGLSTSSNLGEPTTYAGTTIDAVFSNAPTMKVARYQSYYSTHIPLVVDIPAGPEQLDSK